MRTAIATASVVALLAAGTGSAAARSIDPGIHAHGLRYKAEAAYYMHHTSSPNAQDVARDVYPGMRPARVVEVAASGFDWADAGIGAGLAAALLLSAAGASALRREHPVTR
jgi:hypothetical protein